MFKIKYERRVEKDLKHLPKEVIKQVLNRIENLLAQNPLTGEKLEHQGRTFYKYRVRNYRIVYTIDANQKQIGIYRIRHRKEVYRGL